MHLKCPRCEDRWEVRCVDSSTQKFDFAVINTHLSYYDHLDLHEERDGEKDLTYHYED